MKSKELRIGNYVYHKHSIGIKLPGTLTSGKDIELCKEFEPIPLTKEWLIKFGFKKDGVLVDYAICLNNEKIFGIDIKNERAHIYQLKPSIQGVNLCSINYVHELQNLYYTLTKTELNYE
mgnify:CR=1 FL=1